MCPWSRAQAAATYPVFVSPADGYTMGEGPQSYHILWKEWQRQRDILMNDDNWYTVEACEANSTPTVWVRESAGHTAGCLTDAAPFWEDVLLAGDSPLQRESVMGWLRKGVSIREFLNPTGFTGEWKGHTFVNEPTPAPYYEPTHSMTAEHTAFVSEQLEQLLTAGVIRECTVAPRVVMPLHVVENASTGKKRLCHDCRYVNLWTQAPSPRYENIRDFQAGLAKDDWMGLQDHTAGYTHVRIAADSIEYFGFEFQGKHYCYLALGFGWSCSPFVYATLSTTVSAFARRHRQHTTAYLDDLATALPAAWHPLRARAGLQSLAGLQYLAGFCVAVPKSCWVPTTRLQLLGFIVDSSAEQYEVPQLKWQRIQAVMLQAIEQHRLSNQAAASLAGKLQALGLVLSGISIMLSELHADIAVAAKWHTPITHLSVATVTDLRELQSMLLGWQRLSRWRDERHARLDTDANQKEGGGWGAILYVSDHCTTASGRWSDEQRALFDIHQLEALALIHALEALATGITGCRLEWHTDNEICRFVVLKGISQTRDATMQQVSRLALRFQLRNNVMITVHRVSSEENYVADSLSREGMEALALRAEFKLSSRVFTAIAQSRAARGQADWTADAMATADSKQLPRFVADPMGNTLGAMARNVFMYTFPKMWRGPTEVVYCFPPFQLIAAVARHFRLVGVHGTILVPATPKAAWYGALMARATHVERVAVAGELGILLKRGEGGWIPGHAIEHDLLAVDF